MGNEVRLIDANALMKKVRKNLGRSEVLYRIPPHFVDEAPTIDAVPVVRCGDCCKWNTTACPMADDIEHSIMISVMSDDDTIMDYLLNRYCSEAERSDDNA